MTNGENINTPLSEKIEDSFAKILYGLRPVHPNKEVELEKDYKLVMYKSGKKKGKKRSGGRVGDKVTLFPSDLYALWLINSVTRENFRFCEQPDITRLILLKSPDSYHTITKTTLKKLNCAGLIRQKENTSNTSAKTTKTLIYMTDKGDKIIKLLEEERILIIDSFLELIRPLGISDGTIKDVMNTIGTKMWNSVLEESKPIKIKKTTKTK